MDKEQLAELADEATTLATKLKNKMMKLYHLQNSYLKPYQKIATKDVLNSLSLVASLQSQLFSQANELKENDSILSEIHDINKGEF